MTAAAGSVAGAPKRVGPLWMTLFTLAWLAIWTVQLTPIQLLLPLQLDTNSQGQDWIAGVVWAGVVLSVGGLVGIIAAPVSGRWSDRTRSRWGRRRPWAIAGSLVAAAGLVLTGLATGPVAVGAAWIVVSVGVSVAMAALTAMIADQLTSQRGSASAAASSAHVVVVVVGGVSVQRASLTGMPGLHSSTGVCLTMTCTLHELLVTPVTVLPSTIKVTLATAV